MDCARKIQSNTAETEEQNWTPTQRWQALLIAFVQIVRQKDEEKYYIWSGGSDGKGIKTTLIVSNIQDDSTRDWKRGTSCFPCAHPPLLYAAISLITFAVFPVGPDDIYLFGPFNLGEDRKSVV